MEPPTPPDTRSVEIHGPALRVIRQLLNVQRADLCAALSCTPSYISKLETGASRRCSPLFFTQLLAYLGLNTAEGRRALLAFPYADVDAGPDTEEMTRPPTDPSGIPVAVTADPVPAQRGAGRHRRGVRQAVAR